MWVRCNVIGGSDKKVDGTKHHPFISNDKARCWKCCSTYTDMIKNDTKLMAISQKLELFDLYCWTGTVVQHGKVRLAVHT